MRYLKKLIWAALIAGATASPVLAQGGMSSGGGLSGGSSGGAMGGSGGLGGSSGGTSSTATALSTLGGTPLINAPSALGGNSGNSSVSSSNFLSSYFGNPYYQGTLANASNSSDAPGGFGTATFGSSGGSGGGQIGFAGTTSGSSGRAGGGAKGGTSSTNNNNNSGIVIPLPTQISYAAVPKFKIDPVSATQIQTEVLRMLRNSRNISYPATVLVSTEGNVVTIRGNAKDRDEARDIEVMIRMTPGVRAVKNEITYPKE
jgi:hypothetical protein